jgi:membrane associated rhomboid family serine protease
VLTRVLVALNVIAYLWEMQSGALDSNAALETHGGLVGADVLAGDWWRIFTSAFLHGSLMHIAFNMIALWQVGTFVELIFGTPRMAIIYFISMVGSGLAATYFTAPDEVTIGASGAIFGLFGALAYAGFRLGDRGRDIMRQTSGIIVINLIIGFIPGLNISYQGHIGGLIAGTLCGLVLYRPLRLAVAQQPEGPQYAQRIAPHDDPGVVTIEHPPLPEAPGEEPPL